MYFKLINSNIIFNLILLVLFSLSVNSVVEIKNINVFFYILFHITFIYIIFYHYHFTIYILGLIYGILFDVLLLNYIGAHLFCFIFFISIYNLIKKYLLLLSSIQVSTVIFIILILTLYSELIFAFLFNNIYFSFSLMIKYLLISVFLFIPSIYLLNKLDK